MLGDLPKEIGTDPKYPAIVDHTWLSVDKASYDNYPSDNNTIRVVPELAELWDHSPKPSGPCAIPNQHVTNLGQRLSETKKQVDVSPAVIREAKKAMMTGCAGKQVADHIRSLFTASQIEGAKEGLKEASKEMGLLGNVYVDATAFGNLREAEQFLQKHRSRLARDIVYDAQKMDPNVISFIASNYRKNAVTEIKYNQELFDNYKNHLVASGRISKDYVIDSKESLRTAFLTQPEVKDTTDSVEKPAVKLSDEERTEGLMQLAHDKQDKARQASEELAIKVVYPVLAYAQEQLSKGKDTSDLKDMLRGKFAKPDLEASVPYLAVAISEQGLSRENIDNLVENGKLSSFMGDQLKVLGKKHPIKKSSYEKVERSQPIAAEGYLYTPFGSKETTDDLSAYRRASAEALRKGISVESIRNKLAETIDAEKVDIVMADAVNALNTSPAGVKANTAKPSAKKSYDFDVKKRDTLPGAETVIPQAKEIMSFFEGANTDIEIGANVAYSSDDVVNFNASAGIDENLM